MPLGKKLIAKPLILEATRQLRQRVRALERASLTPALKVILVGHHPPSLIYTRNKKKFCESIRVKCDIVQLPESLSLEQLQERVRQYNEDSKIHGIFIQFPLPDHLAHHSVEQLITPKKDVDGLHAHTIGKIYRGQDESAILSPCTPKGIIRLLKYYEIALRGKYVTIIGRSHIVGRPLALMLTNHHATVSLCHSQTCDLKRFTTISDIIVCAVGRPGLIRREHIGANKPVVIDVGINVVDGKLCGDADYHDIVDMCSGITPVPGGIGPLTILSLGENLVLAAERVAQKRGVGDG